MRARWMVPVLLFGATSAMAEGQFYAGIGAGVAEVSFDRDLRGSDTALQVFGGYSLNRYISGELGYLDAGKVDSRFGAPVETTGITATAIGSLPLGNRWSLYARVGAIAWEWEAAGISHEGIDVLYGLGAGMKIGRIDIRVEASATHLDREEMRAALLQGLWRF